MDIDGKIMYKLTTVVKILMAKELDSKRKTDSDRHVKKREAIRGNVLYVFMVRYDILIIISRKWV